RASDHARQGFSNEPGMRNSCSLSRREMELLIAYNRLYLDLCFLPRSRRKLTLVRVPDDIPLLEINHGLRDVRGVVGDPLEASRGVDQAEPGVEPVGIAADLVLEHLQDVAIVAIDGAVAADDRARQLRVRLGERIERVADLAQGLHRQRLELLGDRERLGI